MHGEYKVPGGKLVVVDLELEDDRIASVQVSGDFFLEPESALEAIDLALCGLPADANEALLAAAIHVTVGPGVSMHGFSPQAVAIAVRRAIDGAAQ